MTDHDALIQDQFTRQVAPFTAFIADKTVDLAETIAEAAALGPDDAALDVACGPGQVVEALARRAGSVRGIDIVPAMLDAARARIAAAGLLGVAFDLGDVGRLPYPDARFDAVVSRFAFHHVENPASVLAEMARVTKPGGRIVLCDVALPRAKAEAYDRAECVRDPSHTHALVLEEIDALFADALLGTPSRSFVAVEAELESKIAMSFPVEGGGDRLRAIYAADVGVDALGMGVHRRGDAIHFHFPTLVLRAVKP